MDKKTYNKFMQIWRMFFGSNIPLDRANMEFVCEHSDISLDDAMSVLEQCGELYNFSIEKIVALGFE